MRALHTITLKKVINAVGQIPKIKRIEKKDCGCQNRKQKANNLIPGLGDAISVVANPIAKHIINPLFKTNLGS